MKTRASMRTMTMSGDVFSSPASFHVAQCAVWCCIQKTHSIAASRCASPWSPVPEKRPGSTQIWGIHLVPCTGSTQTYRGTRAGSTSRIHKTGGNGLGPRAGSIQILYTYTHVNHPPDSYMPIKLTKVVCVPGLQVQGCLLGFLMFL